MIRSQLTKDILTGVLPMVICVLCLGLVSVIPSVSPDMRLPYMGIMYFMITILASVLSLFIRKRVFLVFWFLLFPFTLFLGDEAFRTAKLFWNINHLILYPIETLILMLFAAVLFRSFNTNPKQYLKELIYTKESIYKKIGAVFFVLAGSAAAWSLIHIIVKASVYYLPQKRIQITAEVDETGVSKGKYSRHRYWDMTLSSGVKETFWVHAAANKNRKNECSTDSDPKPGSILYLSGRENFLGFAYDKVDSIVNEKGKRVCPTK